MHRRRQNDQTADPRVIKGGEVERGIGRAPSDPPGALAKDIDIKRKRARRCWPRRVLTGSTAVAGVARPPPVDEAVELDKRFRMRLRRSDSTTADSPKA